MSAARLMNRRAARALSLGFLLLAAMAVAASAQTASSIGVLVEQVRALFPKVDGDVLEVKDKAVTLSIGKKDGLTPGVELSVYREGRELRHPTTGVLLGKTEQTIGRVVVDEVLEAYSTGHVTEGTDVRPGDRARVSAGKVALTVVPLVEGVKDGLAEAAVNALVEGLNQTGRFQIAMGDAMAVGMLQEGLQRQDILEGKGLAAKAARLKIENVLVVYVKSVNKKPYMDVRLMSFPGTNQVLASGLFVPPSIKPAPRGDFSAGGGRPGGAATGPRQSLLSRLLTGEMEAGTYSTAEGSIPLKEIAKFPFVVASLDVAVAPGDKIPRLVITDKRKVYLYKIVDYNLEPEWTWTGDASASVFSVQLADLDGDGALEVIVNRYHPNQGILVNSLVLGTKDGKPTTLVKDVNQVLFGMDTTGDGVRRTLWAQDFVPTGFFKKGNVDRVSLKDGRLVQEAKVPVPGTFRATGATMSNIAGKNAFRVLSFIDEYNRLRIAMDTEEVWRSASDVGRGGPKLPVDVPIERGGRTYIYYAEPNPVSIDLDGDGVEEIVVPQNLVPGRLGVVFKGPAGYRFQSVSSGFDGTITGLGAFAAGEQAPSLVVAVTRFYGLLTDAGDTQIIMTIPE